MIFIFIFVLQIKFPTSKYNEKFLEFFSFFFLAVQIFVGLVSVWNFY